MKQIVTVILVFVVLVIITIVFLPHVDKICFDEKKDLCVLVEIADGKEKRAKGLMYRRSLDENKGMLFIFEKEEIHTFWMKNTIIPLDMIWITSEGKVVHIEQAEPCYNEVCKTYYPFKKATYVLEVNIGYTEKNNISVGDMLVIDLESRLEKLINSLSI